MQHVIKCIHFFIRILSLICAFGISSVYAYDEPAVNLGFTSFLDGMPPSGPGWYFQDYFQSYSANKFNGNNGDSLLLPNPYLDAKINIAHIIYLSKQKIGKANWGFDIFLLPWVMQANMGDGLGGTVLKGETGIGDVVVGPIFQFDPVSGPDHTPRFVQRFAFDFILPTGKYNRNYALTPGNNFWSFNPYWAVTTWFTKKWSSSMRLQYLWNAKNTNPRITFGSDAHSTQAGQVIFANITTEYSLRDNLFVGLNGYIYDQFTDTKVNGSAVHGRREYVWAIGPGILFGLTKNDFVFFNTYFEQDARNRPQGTSLLLRYAHHFS